MKLPIDIAHATLHSDLSYKEFFLTYNPYIDGQAFIATYSFNPDNFDFWAKLEPLSVLYIDEGKEKYALAFLKRFPLFEVYSVNQLHTKAVFFYDSGRLLLGSENLFAGTSKFSELMIETTITKEQKDEVVQMAFRSLSPKGKILTCQYELCDISINEQGYPYLPCEKEVTYWDLITSRFAIGKKTQEPEYHSPSYIYHLLEYEINGKTHVLAFNRGYVYCGDISTECFNWLIENCKIEHYSDGAGIGESTASDLTETSPRKDYFFTYHPIASKHRAIKAYWLGAVKNIDKHKDWVAPIKLKDITERKIRRPK